MKLFYRLRKIGQSLSRDHEGNLGTSPIDRVKRRHSFAVFVFVASAYLAGSLHAFADERRIELYNIHTKKDISVIYKRDGKFLPEALKQLNHFMRDWRRDRSINMDPELFDLIWEIHRELGSKKPVHIISGYRSPKTNATLRRTRGGQAKKSKHMTGQAADIHFPDVSVKQLRNSALVRERGGVGYYPTSAIPFVHVDTARVRHWPRLRRQELAILFPSGKSKHVPSDGKPITRKDFQVALARLQSKGGELPIAVQRRLQGDGAAPTVLASLRPTPKIPVPEPAPEAAQPKLVLASLTPFDGLLKAPPARKPGLDEASAEAKSVIQKASLTQPAAQSGDGAFRRDFIRNTVPSAPSDTVPQDQIASAPEYDDDHPDELYYQPFPILPFMSDTPVAFMDLTGEGGTLSLPKVHLFFGESQQMLLTQFQPGLQYAQLFWAQRFRGTAVNTNIKRLVRQDLPQPVQTVQRPTRTAQK
jgi:uncharacterized protein YcbK (DUF882 family)